MSTRLGHKVGVSHILFHARWTPQSQVKNGVVLQRRGVALHASFQLAGSGWGLCAPLALAALRAAFAQCTHSPDLTTQ
jgi:hypothetical protein